MGLALQHVLWSLFWNKKRSLILQDPSFDRKKRKKKKKHIHDCFQNAKISRRVTLHGVLQPPRASV